MREGSWARSASGSPRHRSSASAGGLRPPRIPGRVSVAPPATLETRKIELVRWEPDHVSRRARLDGRRAKSLAELGDLPLHLRNGGDGSRPLVEIVCEPLDGHDTIRIEEQDRERRALLRPSKRTGPPSDDLERPEDAELEHRADGSRR